MFSCSPPNGRKHINGIEGYWSFAKSWLYKYRGMSKDNFHLYLKETEFRFNYRERDLFKFLTDLLTNLVPNLS
ncbi:MAG: transposase [Candidatus Magasanikbacteria bacterium]